MATPVLSPENVSALIDHILKVKDPSTVGLSRILRDKSAEARSFPVKNLNLEEFSEAAGKGIFSPEEKRILQLEKHCADLESQLAQNKKKAEHGMQVAFQKGISEGTLRGEKQGTEQADAGYRKRLAEIEERFAAMFRDVQKSRRELILQSERVVLELSQACAVKVINAELSLNPDIVLAVIKKALGFLAERDRLTVRVAPEDVQRVSGKKDFWTSINDRMEGVSIEPDARIRAGGCIIESACGIADARIEIMVEEIREVIEKAWMGLNSSAATNGEKDHGAGTSA